MACFTREFVAMEFAKRGCNLLEPTYNNAHQSLSYICKCGKTSKKMFLNFRKGSYYCKGCASTGRKPKYDIVSVKQYFEYRGCKLLEDQYIDSRTPMEYICVCGNQSKIRFYVFQRGGRCAECKRRTISLKNCKYTYGDVKNFFALENCTLLESDYTNVGSRLNYICQCGNLAQITFSNFKAGQRCRDCGKNKNAQRFKFGYDYVFDYFKKEGCHLLEPIYKNAQVPVRYICSCGKESKIRFASFKQGVRCSSCGLRVGHKHGRYNSNRQVVKDNYTFGRKCNSLVRMVLIATGQNKNNKSYIMLGYTSKDLKKHLEKFPNWERIKNKKWSIDHIFPIVAFLEYGIYDLKIINGLDNLQPLELRENISKGKKYNLAVFESWLTFKNVKFASKLNKEAA